MVTCLQIHNDYLIPGGETKSTRLIANLLEDKGIKVIRYYKSNDEIVNSGVFAKIFAGINSIYNRKTVQDIKKITKENHISFALVHNTSPLISNSVYKALHDANIPIYKYLQNYNLLCLNGAMDREDRCMDCQKNAFIGVCNKCYKSSLLFSLMKYISKKELWRKYIFSFAGYIAISDFVKQKHVESGIEEKKVHVLYHFCEKEAHIEAKYKKKYFVYMGRLSAEKGIKTLIKAFEKMPTINLKILGTGELENRIRQYISKNKLSNINLLGYKEGQDKDLIVGSAIGLIAPSEWEEPFGRIVIESYQVGTPVIATKTGGLKELVTDGVTGYQFEQGDVEQLIQCVYKMSLMSTKELNTMRNACVNIVNKNFSKDAYWNSFKKIVKIEE